MTTRVRTGGKLYLAGEYAILEPGQYALLAFIPLYMTAEIAYRDDYRLSSDMFSYSVDRTPDSGYALVQDAITLVEDYLSTQGYLLKPFHLYITGKMEKNGKKLGLGSSGSVVVLVVKALLALYKIEADRDLLFKLSSAVLLKRGDNGSMGDLACIVSEDLVLYQSFDRTMVRSWLEKEPLMTTLKRDWGFEIKVVKPALQMDFLVGWTGQVALSSQMVSAVQSSMDNFFLEESKKTVLALARAFTSGDKEAVMESVQYASQLLENLNPEIYTSALQNLKQASQGLQAVAKSSGAGGGDCGIALSFDESSSQRLKAAWQESGVSLIYEERIGNVRKS